MSRHNHRTHEQLTLTDDQKTGLVMLAILIIVMLWTWGQTLQVRHMEQISQQYTEELLAEYPEGTIIVHGNVITPEMREQAQRDYEERIANNQ